MRHLQQVQHDRACPQVQGIPGRSAVIPRCVPGQGSLRPQTVTSTTIDDRFGTPVSS